MESIRLVLTQFTDETISISLAVLVVVFAGLLAYWFYNRRKFHQLSHQIPASVVKNYLDSIIANSTALKSSLFRGGGLDVGEGVPSILPTSELPAGGVAVGDNSEELAQKNAEIANLKSLVGQKDATIAELEKALEAARAGNGGAITEEEANIMKSEISSLKSQLEEANKALEAAKAGGGGGDPELAGKLDSVTKERDELKERLMEYEIIEEDLANLKKFQQENEQLKKTIAELKGEPAPEEAAPEPAPEPAAEEAPSEPEPEPEPEAEAEAEAEPEPVAEEAPAPESDPEPPAEEEAPVAEPPPETTAEENPAADDSATEEAAEENPEVPANEGEQKSAAELLSEFEKMLG